MSYDHYEEENVQPLSDSVEIHKYDVVEYYLFYNPNGMDIYKPVEILKPFHINYPSNFERTVKNINEDELDAFIERQYKLCNQQEKTVFVKYFHSFMETTRDFIHNQSLKYFLIKKRLDRGFSQDENEYDPADDRIIGKLLKEDIIKEFMRLTTKEFHPKGILTKEQVEHLLKANFVGFNPREELKKFDTPNFTQSQLRVFVYDFFKRDKKARSTDKYVRLLLNNFSKFDNTTFESEKRNFSKKA